MMTEESGLVFSEEDEKWLAGIPAALQGIARRHGRELFQLTMQAGAFSHGGGVLLRQAPGNRAVARAVDILTKCYNDLFLKVLSAAGHSPEQFLACRKDIELLAELAGESAPDIRKSPGGIILNS
jgi:hypothetical protein